MECTFDLAVWTLAPIFAAEISGVRMILESA